MVIWPVLNELIGLLFFCGAIGFGLGNLDPCQCPFRQKKEGIIAPQFCGSSLSHYLCAFYCSFMIAITLPDGSVRQYENPLTVLDIAKDISEGLARNVLSAQFNQQTVEASTLIEEDGDLRLFTWNDDEGKTAFWHSSAHILAQSILALYRGKTHHWSRH